MYYRIRQTYRRWLLPHLSGPLLRQRVKLIWHVWGYARLLSIRTLSMGQRLYLLRKFLRIDWHIAHAHTPLEIAHTCRLIAERPARPGEWIIEAGCWQGGGTAKLSLICHLLGYALHVFDSFEGVPDMSSDEIAQTGYDFSGEYAAAQQIVENNVVTFGAREVCTFHPGWFRDTLAGVALANPVRLAYIDCDLASSTREVLQGVVPALTEDACIVSQDYSKWAVRRLLENPVFWYMFDRGTPVLTRLSRSLVSIRFQASDSKEPDIIIHG